MLKSSVKGLSMLEDFIPKENLRQLQAAIEKDQAVQRHVEQLPPYEAAIYILANGCISQKVSMLQRLHITLKDCDEKKTSQLLAELTTAMWTQELELQIAAPEAIITVLPRLNENQLISLLGGVKNMIAVKNEEARGAWSKLALELVPYLPSETVVGEIVPLVLKKAQHAEPADQRLLGARLVGRICRRLSLLKSSESIASCGLLTRAIGLCQDTERYMRVEMCHQLIDIAKAIGPQMTKEKITSELFQLVADEEPPVARAALSALVLDFVDFFDAQYRKDQVWPVLRSYIQSPQDEMVSLLAEVFGKFLIKIKPDLQSSPEDVVLLANFFKMCSQRSDAELRRWCAFNFPAVVTVFPYSVFSSTLSPVLKSLSSDTNTETRKSVAAGLHELIPLLGDRAAIPLKEPVLLLIQDNCLQVRHIIFRKLGQLLDLFANQLRNDEREAFFTAVIPHIVSYENAVHKDWRSSATLLSSFSHFTRYFPGHILSQKFVGPIMHHLMTGAAAVKDLCAPILIQFTRSLTNNQAIVERFGKIVNDFGRSSNAHHRKTYIELFCGCVGVFSRKFIRARLYERLIELAEDPVPNVRLHLARVMPIVRKVLRAPCEIEFSNAFHQALERLIRDSDKDVSEAAQRIRGTLENMERDYSRQAAMRIISTEDTNDKKREEAEGDLSEVSKEMEKIERRQRLREMLIKEQAEMGILDGSGNEFSAAMLAAGGGGGGGPNIISSGLTTSGPSSGATSNTILAGGGGGGGGGNNTNAASNNNNNNNAGAPTTNSGGRIVGGGGSDFGSFDSASGASRISKLGTGSNGVQSSGYGLSRPGGKTTQTSTGSNNTSGASSTTGSYASSPLTAGATNGNNSVVNGGASAGISGNGAVASSGPLGRGPRTSSTTNRTNLPPLNTRTSLCAKRSTTTTTMPTQYRK